MVTGAALAPSARMSAGQCLEHPWLNNLAEKAKLCNRRLKSQVLLKKYVMRRRWKVRGRGSMLGVGEVPSPAHPGGWHLGHGSALLCCWQPGHEGWRPPSLEEEPGLPAPGSSNRCHQDGTHVTHHASW